MYNIVLELTIYTKLKWSFTDKNIDLASTTPLKAEALDATPSFKKTILKYKKIINNIWTGNKITEKD